MIEMAPSPLRTSVLRHILEYNKSHERVAQHAYVNEATAKLLTGDTFFRGDPFAHVYGCAWHLDQDVPAGCIRLEADVPDVR